MVSRHEMRSPKLKCESCFQPGEGSNKQGDYTTSNFAKVLFPALAGGLQQRGGVGVVPPVQHQHRGGPQLAGEERPRQGAAGAGAGGRPRTRSGTEVQKDGAEVTGAFISASIHPLPS